MSTHNICFSGEIRQISLHVFFGLKRPMMFDIKSDQVHKINYLFICLETKTIVD